MAYFTNFLASVKENVLPSVGRNLFPKANEVHSDFIRNQDKTNRLAKELTDKFDKVSSAITSVPKNLKEQLKSGKFGGSNNPFGDLDFGDDFKLDDFGDLGDISSGSDINLNKNYYNINSNSNESGSLVSANRTLAKSNILQNDLLSKILYNAEMNNAFQSDHTKIFYDAALDNSKAMIASMDEFKESFSHVAKHYKEIQDQKDLKMMNNFNGGVNRILDPSRLLQNVNDSLLLNDMTIDMITASLKDPIGALMTAGIGGLMYKLVPKLMYSINKEAERLPYMLQSKMEAYSNNRNWMPGNEFSKDNILADLADMLKLDVRKDGKLIANRDGDLSATANFDQLTRRSIVTVIPGYLAKILSSSTTSNYLLERHLEVAMFASRMYDKASINTALSSAKRPKSYEIYSHEQGKFVNSNLLVKNIRSQVNSATTGNAFGGVGSELRDILSGVKGDKRDKTLLHTALVRLSNTSSAGGIDLTDDQQIIKNIKTVMADRFKRHKGEDLSDYDARINKIMARFESAGFRDTVKSFTGTIRNSESDVDARIARSKQSLQDLVNKRNNVHDDTERQRLLDEIRVIQSDIKNTEKNRTSSASRFTTAFQRQYYDSNMARSREIGSNFSETDGFTASLHNFDKRAQMHELIKADPKDKSFRSNVTKFKFNGFGKTKGSNVDGDISTDSNNLTNILLSPMGIVAAIGSGIMTAFNTIGIKLDDTFNSVSKFIKTKIFKIDDKKADDISLLTVISNKIDTLLNPVKRFLIGTDNKKLADRFTLMGSLMHAFDRRLLIPAKKFLLGTDSDRLAKKYGIFGAIGNAIDTRLLLPLKKALLGTDNDKYANSKNIFESIGQRFQISIINPLKKILLGTDSNTAIKRVSFIDSVLFRLEKSIFKPLRTYLFGEENSKKSMMTNISNYLSNNVFFPLKKALLGTNNDKYASSKTFMESIGQRFQISIVNPLKKALLGTDSTKYANRFTLLESINQRLEKSIFKPLRTYLFGEENSKKSILGNFSDFLGDRINKLVYGNDKAKNNTLWNNIKSSFNEFGSFLNSKVFTPIKNYFADELFPSFVDMMKQIGFEFQHYGSQIKKFFTKDLVIGTKGIMKEILGDDTIASIRKNLVDPFKQAVDKLTDSLGNLLKFFVRIPVNFFKGVADSIKLQRLKRGAVFSDDESKRLLDLERTGKMFDFTNGMNLPFGLGKSKEKDLTTQEQRQNNASKVSSIFNSASNATATSNLPFGLGKSKDKNLTTQEQRQNNASKVSSIFNSASNATATSNKATTSPVKSITDNIVNLSETTVTSNSKLNTSIDQLNSTISSKVNTNNDSSASSKKASVENNSSKLAKLKAAEMAVNNTSSASTNGNQSSTYLGNNTNKATASNNSSSMKSADPVENLSRISSNTSSMSKALDNVVGFMKGNLREVDSNLSAIRRKIAGKGSILGANKDSIAFESNNPFKWIGSKLGAMLDVPFRMIKSTLDGVYQGFKKIADLPKQIIETTFRITGSLLRGFTTVIGNVSQGLIDVSTTIFSTIGTVLSKSVEVIGSFAVEAAKGLGSLMISVTKLINPIAEAVGTVISETFRTLTPIITNLTKLVGQLAGNIANIVGLLSDLGMKIIYGGINTLGRLFGKALNLGEGGSSFNSDKVVKVDLVKWSTMRGLNPLEPLYVSVVDPEKNPIKGISSRIKESGSSLINKVKDSWKSSSNNTTTTSNQSSNNKPKTNEKSNSSSGLGTGLLTGVGGALGAVFSILSKSSKTIDMLNNTNVNDLTKPKNLGRILASVFDETRSKDGLTLRKRLMNSLISFGLRNIAPLYMETFMEVASGNYKKGFMANIRRKFVTMTISKGIDYGLDRLATSLGINIKNKSDITNITDAIRNKSTLINTAIGNTVNTAANLVTDTRNTVNRGLAKTGMVFDTIPTLGEKLKKQSVKFIDNKENIIKTKEKPVDNPIVNGMTAILGALGTVAGVLGKILFFNKIASLALTSGKYLGMAAETLMGSKIFGKVTEKLTAGKESFNRGMAKTSDYLHGKYEHLGKGVQKTKKVAAEKYVGAKKVLGNAATTVGNTTSNVASSALGMNRKDGSKLVNQSVLFSEKASGLKESLIKKGKTVKEAAGYGLNKIGSSIEGSSLGKASKSVYGHTAGWLGDKLAGKDWRPYILPSSGKGFAADMLMEGHDKRPLAFNKWSLGALGVSAATYALGKTGLAETSPNLMHGISGVGNIAGGFGTGATIGSMLMPGVGTLVGSIIGGIYGAVKGIPKIIGAIENAFRDTLNNIYVSVSSFPEKLNEMITSGLDLFTSSIDKLPETISTLFSMPDPSEIQLDPETGLPVNESPSILWKITKSIGKAAFAIIANIPKVLTTLLGGAISLIGMGLAGGVGLVVEGVTSMFQWIGDKISNGWFSAINSLQEAFTITVPSWVPGYGGDVVHLLGTPTTAEERNQQLAERDKKHADSINGIKSSTSEWMNFANTVGKDFGKTINSGLGFDALSNAGKDISKDDKNNAIFTKYYDSDSMGKKDLDNTKLLYAKNELKMSEEDILKAKNDGTYESKVKLIQDQYDKNKDSYDEKDNERYKNYLIAKSSADTPEMKAQYDALVHAQKFNAKLNNTLATPSSLEEMISNTALKFGIDPNIMIKMAQIESTMNPNARSKTSSAKGLFQFTDATGNAFGLKTEEDFFNPELNTIAAAKYIKNNMAYLKGAGIPITPATVYLAHQQGPTGLATIFNAINTGRPLPNNIIKNMVNNNPGLNEADVKNPAMFMSAWESKLGSASQVVRSNKIDTTNGGMTTAVSNTPNATAEDVGKVSVSDAINGGIKNQAVLDMLAENTSSSQVINASKVPEQVTAPTNEVKATANLNNTNTVTQDVVKATTAETVSSANINNTISKSTGNPVLDELRVQTQLLTSITDNTANAVNVTKSLITASTNISNTNIDSNGNTTKVIAPTVKQDFFSQTPVGSSQPNNSITPSAEAIRIASGNTSSARNIGF